MADKASRGRSSRNKGANGVEKESVWKDIPGYEGLYQASNMGEIRSLPRNTTKGRILKQYQSRANGYCYVVLSKENRRIGKRVHKLVMLSFCGQDLGRTQINHIDGNKHNNALSNLEWCTGSENMHHAYDTGLEKKPGKMVIDLDTGEVYETLTSAARSVGGKRGEMVARVCHGVKSHYRNHHFAFYDDFLNKTLPEFKGKYKRKGSVALWK